MALGAVYGACIGSDTPGGLTAAYDGGGLLMPNAAAGPGLTGVYGGGRHCEFTGANIVAYQDFIAGETLVGATLRGTLAVVARSSPGRFYDKNGVMQSAGNNVVRIGHSFNGNAWIKRGLIAEPQDFNEIEASQSISLWGNGAGTPTKVADTDVAPDGTTTADTIGDNDGAASESVTGTIITVGDSETWTGSVHVKKDSVAKTTRFVLLRMTYSGGVTTTLDLTFDTSTGEVKATITAGSGTIPAFGVIDLEGYWRFWIAAKNDASLNTALAMDLFPAIGANTDLLTYNVATTGEFVPWGAQAEERGKPSSYIATGISSNAVRRSDDVSITFSPAIGAAEFTVLVNIFREVAPAGGEFLRVFRLGNAGATELAEVFATTTSLTGRVTVTTLQANIGTGAVSLVGENKMALAVDLNDVEFAHNGVRVGSIDTSADFPSDLTKLGIGSRNGATDHFGEFISSIVIREKRLASALLNTLTI